MTTVNDETMANGNVACLTRRSMLMQGATTLWGLTSSAAMDGPPQQETADQAENRLLKVIAAARFEILAPAYGFAPLRADAPPEPSALACVRDGDHWFQLIPLPLSPRSDPGYKVFSFHFSPSISASGFVGWLASDLTRTVGTGVIVICGKDAREMPELRSASLDVFDYWGCPFEIADGVLAEVRTLRNRGAVLAERDVP
jgi:hypothetical protein